MRSDGATERRSDGGANANEIIRDLRLVVSSLSVDSRGWDDERNAALARRFPWCISGIDWARVQPMVEATLDSAQAGREFVAAAVSALHLSLTDRALLIGDNLLDEALALEIEDLAPCVAELVALPLGFVVGPLDESWDWVIDVRFAGAAWAGRAPEMNR